VAVPIHPARREQLHARHLRTRKSHHIPARRAVWAQRVLYRSCVLRVPSATREPERADGIRITDICYLRTEASRWNADHRRSRIGRLRYGVS
jgi:hypothetical protein